MTLQEATSLAPDALTIGLSIFLVSFVAYLAYGKKKNRITKSELTILYSLAFIIGLCKIVYAPLVLLYFLIPASKFGSKKAKVIHATIIGVIFLILNISWLLISASLIIEFQPGVNSGAQVAHILANPLHYLSVGLSTIELYGINWLYGVLGITLGAFNFILPNFYFVSTLVFVSVLLLQKHERIVQIKPLARTLFCVIFFSIFILICTSVYLQWTAVGANIIEGVQGRYFIPILALLPFMLNRKHNSDVHAEIITEPKIFYYAIMMNAIALIVFFAQNV